jgi:hypothetical protein
VAQRRLTTASSGRRFAPPLMLGVIRARSDDQEGIPEVIPPEACYLGWQESLTLLARLVEAEIPD